MPRLLQNIEGTILDNFESRTIFPKSIEGSYGEEDYIKIGSFEAYLQDLRQGETIVNLNPPSNFGLQTNINIVTLEISY